MAVFINLSNHPSTGWSKEQLNAAQSLGTVKDIQFPNIPAGATTAEVSDIVADFVAKLPRNEKVILHLMGEFTFCYLFQRAISGLDNVTLAVACSERNCIEDPEKGTRTYRFEFQQFRLL